MCPASITLAYFATSRMNICVNSSGLLPTGCPPSFAMNACTSDEPIALTSHSKIQFVKLVPLVGG